MGMCMGLLAIFQFTFGSIFCRFKFLYMVLCQVFKMAGHDIEISRTPAKGILNGTRGGTHRVGWRFLPCFNPFQHIAHIAVCLSLLDVRHAWTAMQMVTSLQGSKVVKQDAVR